MTGAGPTGGSPTAGSPAPAGSGDWLVSGTSSATFLNGASYTSAQLFSTGGSGASFAGAGHTTLTNYEYIYENVAMSDIVTRPAAAMSYGELLTDGMTFGLGSRVSWGLHAAASMTFAGHGTYVWTPGADIVEGFKVTGAQVASIYMHVAMTQRLKLAHQQVLSMLASITEHMTLTPVVEAYLGSIMLNRMRVTDQANVAMIYALTHTEALRIASIFQKFAGAFVTENLTVGDDAQRAYTAVTAITEFLTLALDQSYVMAFRMTIKDGVDLDDATILNMIYSESMTEVIDLEILYQSPNGNVTSWAINTRTGAVTEYQGWSFNSFATIGNKYIAANRDGLYELNGAQDNGLSVVADIMGSFLQPGSGHLAGLKGVYLGQTGQGYWLLKIDTGDGREYVYQRLSNPALMTTKFTIGKGINARYIGWELINVEGQDFSIDNVEFVPMLRTRRI